MKKVCLVMSVLGIVVSCKTTDPVITNKSGNSSITAISPTSGGAGTPVSITGTNFNAGASGNTVTFSGVAASVVSATTTSIIALAPAGGSTGAVVVNGTAGPVFTYTGTSGPVTISGIDPATGGAGTTVIISGTGFSTITGDDIVTFNGLSAEVIGATTTALTVKAPVGGTTGTVQVNGVNGPTFTYTASGTSGAGDPNVYVVGYESGSNGLRVAKYWNGGKATALSNGTHDAVGNAIVASGTDIYVAGYESSDNLVPVARYWRNGTAVALTDGKQNAFGNGIAVSGSDVYVAGTEDDPETNIAIAKYWKNGTEVVLSHGLFVVAQANAIFVSGSDVYVAGFEQSQTNESLIAKYWKNGVAVPLSDSTGEHVASATAVTVVGNDVYVSGFDTNASGQTVAKVWKNGTATALSDGTFDAQANAVLVAGGDVYATGFDAVIQSGYSIAKFWKNGSGTQISGSTSVTPPNFVIEIAEGNGIGVSGSDVFVAGDDDSTKGNGLINAVYWKNTTMVPLTDGTNLSHAAGIYVKP